MPMDFPDFESLKRHAEILRFREPTPGETEQDFRRALAEYVLPKDKIEAEEILNGRSWDQWTPEENDRFVLKTILRAGINLEIDDNGDDSVS